MRDTVGDGWPENELDRVIYLQRSSYCRRVLVFAGEYSHHTIAVVSRNCSTLVPYNLRRTSEIGLIDLRSEHRERQIQSTAVGRRNRLHSFC